MKSAFSRILDNIVAAVPGCWAAVFADREGEAVDVCAPDTELARLSGAHWGVIHYLVDESLKRRQLGQTMEVIIRTEKQQVIVRRVTADYFLALFLQAESRQIGRARHALLSLEGQLRAEM